MNVSYADNEQHHVLVIEDDDAHALIIESCLRRINIPRINIATVRVRDGLSALEFLERRGTYSEHPFPSLILLDLKLPCMDGRELLARIKSNPEWWLTPVVVLTTSNSRTDRLHAWQLQASGYIVKPMGIGSFRQMLDSALRYWLRWNRLPQAHPFEDEEPLVRPLPDPADEFGCGPGGGGRSPLIPSQAKRRQRGTDGWKSESAEGPP